MKIILLIAISLSLITNSFSQTTWTDYNYITKGYFTTIAQGLDFKKGYNLKEILKGNIFEGSLSKNKYQFSYRSYIKESKPDSTIAIMAILLKNGVVEKVFCIPSAKTESAIWAAFWNDLTARLFADQKEMLIREMFFYFTGVLNVYEANKKSK